MATAEAPKQHLVVLGAGVIGLTIAYLATIDPNETFRVTLVARDVSGMDMDSQAWASPFAGANWSPLPPAVTDQRIRKWERVTFNKFWEMIPTGLVKVGATGSTTLTTIDQHKKLPSKVFSIQEKNPALLWWTDLVRGYQELSPSEIPQPYKFGARFDTISVNPQEYLPWLMSHFTHVVRKQVRSLEELRVLVGTDGILVNATALGAKSIFGVEDTKLYPTRGQTILVENCQVQDFTGADSGGDPIYIIPRPGTEQRNTVLLGGTYQDKDWDTSLDMGIAQQIFDRCAEFEPSLKDSGVTKILRHQVGLRPTREGEARVETEVVKFPLSETHKLVPWVPQGSEPGSMKVVHAYGFGGGGYQASWGAAEDALALVKGLMKGCN